MPLTSGRAHQAPDHHRSSCVFVAITLGITVWASRQNKTAADFYAGGRSFTGFAERHRDRRRLPVGRVVPRHRRRRSRSTATTASSTRSASWSPGWSRCCWSPSCCATPASSRWPTCSRFRLRQRPVRIAAAISTLVVSIFYLLAQMVGAGGLVALLLGIEQPTSGKIASIIVVVGVADDRLRHSSAA